MVAGPDRLQPAPTWRLVRIHGRAIADDLEPKTQLR